MLTMADGGLKQAAPPNVSPDLVWAARVLWGSERVRVSVGGERPSGFRLLEAFAILPNAARPRLLMPLASKQAASSSVREFIVSMNGRARLVKALLSVGMRAGLAQHLVRDRLHVFVAEDALGTDLADVLLEEHLRRAFRRPALEIAVKLDKVRPNWKPVLQLVAPDGDVLGYAKVGWNDLTRGLVRNEADVLERFASRQPRTFNMPRLLHAGRWRDLDLIVVSPMPQRVWSRGPLNMAPPLPQTQEVATLFGAHRRAIAASDYWTRTKGRMAEARAGDPDGGALAPLGEVLEHVEQRYGETFLTFGSWHGDWAPWNMTWLQNRLYVWDWERSAPDVPLGFDVLHYEFQAAIRLERKSVPAAAEACVARSVPFLLALGVPSEAHRPVFLLYLLEIFLRYHESRAAGVKSSEQVYRDLLKVLAGRVRASA